MSTKPWRRYVAPTPVLMSAMNAGKFVVLTIVALVFASSCTSRSTTVGPDTDTTTHVVDTTRHDSTIVRDSTTKQDTVAVAIYGDFGLDSSQFTGAKDDGVLNDPRIPEASGLCASRRYPGMFWTHNDSGNPNDIFLIDSGARLRAIVQVGTVSNRDWEDIAIGPGPDPATPYIYLGEIGDNNAKYPTSMIYRFPEPDVALDSPVSTTVASNIQTITYRYSDGPHNAESLMLDPVTRDVYVVTKGGIAFVYRLSYPQSVDTTIVVKKLAQLPLTLVTGGDISPDGLEILLRTYGQVYYWKRSAAKSVVDALLTTPLMVPYTPEAQGEAVCWSASGAAYYTTSEVTSGVIPHLWRYDRR